MGPQDRFGIVGRDGAEHLELPHHGGAVNGVRAADPRNHGIELRQFLPLIHDRGRWARMFM